jgi:tetratricopeptide (TPR) repeat protein
MLQRRFDALPLDRRAFLETLAVCGRPILPARVFEACGLEGDERPLVALLRSAHLLRTSRTADRVELYHDRIRETLAAEVSPDAARQIHELMARILVAHGDDDPEALFEHYRGAGHAALAAGQAVAAAEKASAVLAFESRGRVLSPGARLAARWRAPRAVHGGAGARARECRTPGRGGRRLPRSGARGQRRAAHRMAAQVGGTAARRRAHRSRDRDHRLGAARDRHARDARPAQRAGSILLRRAQLRWRGLDFVARDASQIAAGDLLRIDACWSITTGLAMVDNIRAAAFHARQLIIALDTGEPYRVARALALEAGFSALGGGAGIQRSAAFTARAQEMAERIGHPHALALVAMSSGIAAFVLGQFRRATELCERALTLLRDECTGVNWEMNLTQDFLLGALLFRGELRDVSHWLPGLLQAARERGNLYFETELRTRMNLVWLVADEPDEGERQANDAIGRWSVSGFHRQHYNHLLARIQTALYRGRAGDAWRIVSEELGPVGRNLWLRVQFFRIEIAFLRARSALAMAAADRGQARRLRAVAADDVRRLTRENMPWSNALALLVRATLACQQGDAEAAATLLTDAIEAFTQVDMHLYAAVARRRLGGIVGGQRGRTLQREANEWMARPAGPQSCRLGPAHRSGIFRAERSGVSGVM